MVVVSGFEPETSRLNLVGSPGFEPGTFAM